jgi:hypothetical protein
MKAITPLLLALLLAAPAAAQDAGTDDAGADDAGAVVDAGAADDAGAEPDACELRCDGDVLHYCDGESPATLDCATLGASCGLLDDEWGLDCVLAQGSTCDPGYADGSSRCGDGCCACLEEDPDDCAAPESEWACAATGDDRCIERPAPDDPFLVGTGGNSTATATTCFGCAGFDPFFAALLFGLGLRARRRR